MNNQQRVVVWKKALVSGACLVIVIFPLWVWFISVDSPVDYFTRYVPPGQALYVFSKLCGLMALTTIWLQCIIALARFSPALRGFVRVSPVQHAVLGGAAFLLVLLHLSFFIGASSARTGHSAMALLRPQFDSGFYSSYVSVGVIAFWLLVAVVLAGLLRSRGRVVFRWVHHGALPALALGYLHGISIGSETRYGLMAYVYAFIGLSILAAVSSWLWHGARNQILARRARDGLIGSKSTIASE